MIIHALLTVALLTSVTGLCNNPMMRGLAPDVILPSFVTSGLRCPPPQVFDRFLCICVDPSLVASVRWMPSEGRSALRHGPLSTSSSSSTTRLAAAKIKKPTIQSSSSSSPSLTSSSSFPSTSFPFPAPHLVGLPDVQHLPGKSLSWGTVQTVPTRGRGVTVVPALNPYGSFNLPANSKVMAAAMAKAKARRAKAAAAVSDTRPRNSKGSELLEKIRWREQLKREAAQAAATVPATSARLRGTGLDLFRRESLNRLLYG
ncbi:uncharacterized protein LOC143294183 [Babylonia areolata]|uniref:uncharacterized protein LOC143294183 n=1 Tax=Babylonia areolata TaxID=304850 RepID=UPI003FCFEBC5